MKMIVVFGSISMELHIPVEHFPAVGESVSAGDYTINAGGRGANQALSAARSGAKVAIVGKTGDDDFSKRILDKIRSEGVLTSGVGKSDENHTGMEVICKDPAKTLQIIKSPGANVETTAEQVPDEILDDKAFVLVQTELAMQENETILTRAKAQGAKTVMNLAPSLDLNPVILENLDYLIVNQQEGKKLAAKLGLPAEGKAEKIAQALAQLGQLICIITLGEQGAIACTQDGAGWEAQAVRISDEELADTSGAEDAYCGTLTACLYAELSLDQAMKRASIAASLTCKKPGTQNAFPYVAEIDEEMDALADPVAL